MTVQSSSGTARPASQVAVDLIPWDPESPQHIERLVGQRVQCGWNANKVATTWREAQRKGTKCIYWIILSGDDERPRQLLEEHIAKYPLESEPLQDTSGTIRGVARTPSNTPIHPIGHISLDAGNPDSEALGLGLPATGVYWISSFYVSWALQSRGLGRAAMDKAEAMAVTPPLSAQILAIDTLSKDDQTRPDVVEAFYESTPNVVNQNWYERRGYRAIKTVENYYGSLDKSGNAWNLRTVFMKKELPGGHGAGKA